MFEEQKVEILNSENCPYCKKQITENDGANGIVNMFLSTECCHSFHIPCFKEYAKSKLVTPKKNHIEGQEIQFEDV